MLKRVPQTSFSRLLHLRRSLSHVAPLNQNDITPNIANTLEVVESSKPQKSVLEPLDEDISHIGTYLKPTYNVAAYANKSELIQQLVQLGVNLHYIEKKLPQAMKFLLQCKFDTIKDHIRFLNDLGVELVDVAGVITKNPLVLKESLEDLEVRINYLKFKKFDSEGVVRIVSKNPFWLTHSTQDIDAKLGFFQSTFHLTGDQVRQVTLKKPQLITFSQSHIKTSMFVLKEEMGFTEEDLKEIILVKPGLYMNTQDRVLKTFDYVHNVMKIPHEGLLKNLGVLTCRDKKLKQRHQFLVKLKRDQFDPTKPNYISLMDLAKGSDVHFATEIAKSTINEFNLFLKTL